MKNYNLFLFFLFFNIFFIFLIIYKQNKIIQLKYMLQNLENQIKFLTDKQNLLKINLMKNSDLNAAQKHATEFLNMQPIKLKMINFLDE